MIDLKTLLIFDVDGTLTFSAGLTRVAFEKAAEQIYGIKDSTRGIMPFGSTDQQIFKEILINNQLPTERFDDQFNRFARLSGKILQDEIENHSGVYLLEGIKDLLVSLKNSPTIALALGTGNIETNANIKLRRHGVDGMFPIGGFGTDHIDRDVVIRKAYERACSYYEKKFDPLSSWVIGDTPKDILSGKANGLRTYAVATGNYCVEELTEYSPDAVSENLSNIQNFMRNIAVTKGGN